MRNGMCHSHNENENINNAPGPVGRAYDNPP